MSNTETGMDSAEPLIFMMGKYEARIPVDRAYTKNHLWLGATEEAGLYRVGLTAYSIRLLQDIYFLDWSIDPETAVAARQEIGEIESSKALSSLYTPAAGILREFNENVLSDPSAINTDGYESGWLYTLQTTDSLLTPGEYISHLEAGWEQDQRYLKGQVNR